MIIYEEKIRINFIKLLMKMIYCCEQYSAFLLYNGGLYFWILKMTMTYLIGIKVFVCYIFSFKSHWAFWFFPYLSILFYHLSQHIFNACPTVNDTCLDSIWILLIVKNHLFFYISFLALNTCSKHVPSILFFWKLVDIFQYHPTTSYDILHRLKTSQKYAETQLYTWMVSNLSDKMRNDQQKTNQYTNIKNSCLFDLEFQGHWD